MVRAVCARGARQVVAAEGGGAEIPGATAPHSARASFPRSSAHAAWLAAYRRILEAVGGVESAGVAEEASTDELRVLASRALMQRFTCLQSTMKVRRARRRGAL